MDYKMKGGYLLTELLISLFIFSSLALLTFQLATIFIVKTNSIKNSSNTMQSLWFAQDLLSRDLKGMPQIQMLEGGFVGSSGELDTCWRIVGKTLQRKTGKYNLATGSWVVPKSAIVCLKANQFKVEQIDNGFDCKISALGKSLKFFISKRL